MTMTEIPRIVSADDHVVEPADVWVSRLPAKYRDIGPRVVMAPPGTPVLDGGTYREAPGTEGDPVAWWSYEDQQYSVKRLIAAAGYPAEEIERLKQGGAVAGPAEPATERSFIA